LPLDDIPLPDPEPDPQPPDEADGELDDAEEEADQEPLPLPQPVADEAEGEAEEPQLPPVQAGEEDASPVGLTVKVSAPMDEEELVAEVTGVQVGIPYEVTTSITHWLALAEGQAEPNQPLEDQPTVEVTTGPEGEALEVTAST